MNFEFSETDLRRLDLNLLLVLAALMRERSVRRAAARLFVGPPAVSMALGRLRDLIGDDLFVRCPGGMQPTPRAIDLHDRVAPLLQGVHEAVFRPATFDPAQVRRTIRFASPDDLDVPLLPRLLALLRAQAPDITLIARPVDFTAVTDILVSGDVDLMISSVPPGIGDVVPWRPLYRDGFEALFDPGRLGPGPLALDRYLALPHLLFSPRGEAHGLIDNTLARIGQRRRIVATLVRFSTLPDILREIPAVATVPGLMARLHAGRFGLVAHPLPFPAPAFEVGMVWPHRLRTDPAILWLADQVRSLVDALRREAGHTEPVMA